MLILPEKSSDQGDDNYNGQNVSVLPNVQIDLMIIQQDSNLKESKSFTLDSLNALGNRKP